MTMQGKRRAVVKRVTKETNIHLELELDGQGIAEVQSGIAFMDHMLNLLAVHSFFNLKLNAQGDTKVDGHHTVEDLGICLGQALSQALSEKAGISRYGQAYVPMDETLARVCLDLSNRAYLHYEVALPQEKTGSFDTCLIKEFLRAFCLHAGCTMHVDLIRGDNSHHILEAIFKALAKALHQAVASVPQLKGQLSSKGTL